MFKFFFFSKLTYILASRDPLRMDLWSTFRPWPTSWEPLNYIIIRQSDWERVEEAPRSSNWLCSNCGTVATIRGASHITSTGPKMFSNTQSLQVSVKWLIHFSEHHKQSKMAICIQNHNCCYYVSRRGVSVNYFSTIHLCQSLQVQPENDSNAYALMLMH